MDLVQFVASLLDLHKQQLQALARQGEIQAAVLSRLLDKDGPGPRGQGLRMPRLKVEEGNTEVYLSVFEQAAASCKLPRAEWGAKLARLMGQEVLEDKCPISTSSTLPDYDALKARILSKAWAEEDQSRQDFFSVRYDPLKGVRELGRSLDWAAKRWLRPEHRTAVQVEQQVAMKQFVSLLPDEAGVWVHRQHPRDMEEAIRLAEECLSLSSEESCSTSTTPTRQTDTSDRQTEPGDTGTTKRRICDPTGIKENITKSFLNKLDTVKLESVHFSLDIPELEVIFLEEEGLDEKKSLKQEVYEQGFHSPQIPTDREHAPQSALLCMQDSLQQECTDRRGRLRTKDHSSLAAVERILVASSERHKGTVPPLSQPRRSGSITQPHLATPTPSEPAPTTCEVLSVSPHLAPPLLCSSALSRYQDAMVNGCLKDREDFRWRPFLSRLGQKRKHPHTMHESSLPTWIQETLPQPHKPRTPADRTYTHCCPDCGRSFTQVSSLQEHRNIHTGEKPFCCEQCGKAFHHRRTLNKHSRVHSGERPFHCLQCGWTFKLKDALKRHQLTHNRDKSSSSCLAITCQPPE
ncbi:hypothetical protein COCON_G00076280 [Conger conger]|uniref:Uncharacterized protein n=1 Tax=Conger conger TaxID=82655 RepID=A0A9Q1DNX8_CONCO|nr:zinc finger and SCAN domain-containing protein 21-like [Conger conger]KAJ8275876.1 hypothetical protein COCON_G00076280 [Conger conger]